MEPKNLAPEQIEANRQAFQDAYNGNDNVIQGNFGKTADKPECDNTGDQGYGAYPADWAEARKVWTRLKDTAQFRYDGRARLTDEQGNLWEFDFEDTVREGKVLRHGRVLYELQGTVDTSDTPGGGDLDVDVLGQLTIGEVREMQVLFARYMTKLILSSKHLTENEKPAYEARLKTPVTLTGHLASYYIQHDGGKIINVRRDTGRPETNLEDQQAITQSQLYRDTLATGHQDAQAQVVRNEIGLAIQILRNLIVELRSDVTEVSAVAEGSVTSGEILNLYFRELLEYKGQLDSGKNTTEEQDRRVFFVMAVIAFYKTQRDFLKNPAQNQLPAHMRQLRRR